MTRREFIALLGGAAAAWPLAARAQRQRKIWRVGFLAMPLRPAVLESSRYAAFAQGMRKLGYVEGDNLAIEYRFAEGETERLSNLVAELLELKPDVLVVAGTQAVGAAQEATTSIPIVMATTNDPIGSGFVQGLARPGGNITGLSNLSTDLSPKLMEMLRSIAPKLSRVAILVNPTNQSHAPVVASLRAAAQGVNLEIGTVEAATPQEIESAFTSMNQQNPGAVIVAADAFFIQQGRQIADLALKRRMPSVFSFREQVDAGGLMSYGQHLVDNFRRAATYVDKIFKGAKPADLPVEQSTKLELVINLRIAKALGLTIPPELLVLATEVIE
jgi:putative tryptophan/tyrosine transport system substrate-binding protein